MVNKLFLVTLCCAFGLNVSAQLSIGFEGGANINSLHSFLIGQQSIQNKSEVGYSFSTSASYQINHWFEISILPSLFQKNYKIERTDSLSGIYQKYNNTYLQVPLLAHFLTGGKIIFFFEPGFFISYWLNSQIKGNIPDILSSTAIKNSNGSYTDQLNLVSFNEKVQFNKLTDNRFEYGWVIGAGIGTSVADHYHLYSVIRYYYSLSDTHYNYIDKEAAQWNRSISINIGINYTLK